MYVATQDLPRRARGTATSPWPSPALCSSTAIQHLDRRYLDMTKDMDEFLDRTLRDVGREVLQLRAQIDKLTAKNDTLTSEVLYKRAAYRELAVKTEALEGRCARLTAELMKLRQGAERIPVRLIASLLFSLIYITIRCAQQMIIDFRQRSLTIYFVLFGSISITLPSSSLMPR